MAARFTPPYPIPREGRVNTVLLFVRGWRSWFDVLPRRSYSMRLGRLRIPALPIHLVNDLTLVRRVLDGEVERFPKHGALRTALEPLIGDGVFAANGTEWAEQRAMLNPAFGHTALKRVFAAMRAAVDDLVARLEREDLTRPVAIDPFVTHVAADIIFRTLFSRPLTEAESGAIYRGFLAYQQAAQRATMLRFYRLPTLGFQRRAGRAAARIHAVYAAEVAARYAAAEEGRGADILQALLDARHPGSGRAFTRAEVMEQVTTIFLAGHETSASVIGWALYLLALDPALQDAVRAEAGEGPLAYERLRAMETTRNVFKETLRLYPPVSFLVRAAARPVRLHDRAVAPGEMVVVSPWLIHRCDHHFPEPHGFDHDRFADPAQAGACRHAYLPFGKGPRTCVGAGFALQEGVIALAGVVQRFRLDPCPDHLPAVTSRLTLRARDGIRLRLSRIAAPR